MLITMVSARNISTELCRIMLTPPCALANKLQDFKWVARVGSAMLYDNKNVVQT